MKLYKSVELPLLYETDATRSADVMGILIKDEMYEIRNCTFYEVSSIGPQYSDSDNTSVITSGGVTYSVNMPYKELKKIIEDAVI